MTITNVYIDVENTLTVPFLSGIQRVTRSLVEELTRLTGTNFRFCPVQYCHICQGWIKIPPEKLATPTAFHRSMTVASTYTNNTDRSMFPDFLKRLLHPTYRKLAHTMQAHSALLLPRFESGSLFFDMDSSWHNKLKRSVLLPRLREQNIKIVTLHYDIIPLLFPDLTHPRTIALFKEHLAAHLQQSSLFACISKNSEKDLIAYSPAPIKTKTIRLGDELLTQNSQPESWPLPKNITTYLLCVGTIEPRKNHNTILDSFDRLTHKHPNLHLVLVGPRGWYADNILQRILTHNLYNRKIFWFKSVGDNVLAKLYQRAFISIFSSFYEGYGLPVSEGLRLGCVTICSNTAALHEAGQDDVDYFKPTDVGHLTKLVDGYLSDPLRYARRKRKIAKRQRQTWDQTALDLVHIFENTFQCNRLEQHPTRSHGQ